MCLLTGYKLQNYEMKEYLLSFLQFLLVHYNFDACGIYCEVLFRGTSLGSMFVCDSCESEFYQYLQVTIFSGVFFSFLPSSLKEYSKLYKYENRLHF